MGALIEPPPAHHTHHHQARPLAHGASRAPSPRHAQLFGGKFRDFPEGNPQANYDNFFYAAISTLQLITCSQWNAIAIDAHRALGPGTNIYFILVVFLGRYIMLQMLTAIFIAKLVPVAPYRTLS